MCCTYRSCTYADIFFPFPVHWVWGEVPPLFLIRQASTEGMIMSLNRWLVIQNAQSVCDIVIYLLGDSCMNIFSIWLNPLERNGIQEGESTKGRVVKQIQYRFLQILVSFGQIVYSDTFLEERGDQVPPLWQRPDLLFPGMFLLLCQLGLRRNTVFYSRPSEAELGSCYLTN